MTFIIYIGSKERRDEREQGLLFFLFFRRNNNSLVVSLYITGAGKESMIDISAILYNI